MALRVRKKLLVGARSSKEAAQLAAAFGAMIDVTYPGNSLVGSRYPGIVVLPLNSSKSDSEKEKWEEWVNEYLKTKLAKGAQLVVL